MYVYLFSFLTACQQFRFKYFIYPICFHQNLLSFYFEFKEILGSSVYSRIEFELYFLQPCEVCHCKRSQVCCRTRVP